MKSLIARLFSRKAAPAAVVKQKPSQTPDEIFLDKIKSGEEDRYGRVAWPVLTLDDGSDGVPQWRIKWSPELLAAWAVKASLSKADFEQVAVAVERRLGELRITCEVLQTKTELFRNRLKQC